MIFTIVYAESNYLETEIMPVIFFCFYFQNNIKV